jgi:regulatory protein
MRESEDELSGSSENSGTPAGDGCVLDDPEGVARAVALRRLAAAPQTRAQLDQAMKKKGVPEHVRERVLDRFGEVKLIDDAAFAAAWVESRHAGRGLARRALSHELRQRGVPSGVAEQAVEALPAEREEERARELVAKRLASSRGLAPAARNRRLVAMLARKGYPAGLAYRVVREGLESEGVDGSSLPPEPLED